MQEYFENPENRTKLLEVIESWEGSPYEHMGESRSGIDCTKLFLEIFYELNIFFRKPSNKIYFAPDWMTQSAKGKLIKTVEKTIDSCIRKENYFLAFYKMESDQIKFGDVLFFSFLRSGVCHHSAIYLGENKIFHVSNRSKCLKTDLEKSFERRIKYVFRLMEK